jgi:manganese-dependent inorganic pyrophosphatase
MIYLVSHKNPDTDSIVSTIVMEDFFKKLGQKAKAFRLGDINKETIFVLRHFGQRPPALIKNLFDKKVFLIDHNELEQSGKGLDKAEIVGVLDHHRLGGLETVEAVFARIEPVGSTSTLVFKLFKEKGFKLNKKQAALLLAGIISDTLNFVSPTTTDEDKKIANELEGISGKDIVKLSKEMFKERFSLRGISFKDLIKKDYKEFKLGKTKIGVAVWETANQKDILENKSEVLELLNNLKKEKKVSLIFFGLLDIIKKECFLFVIGNKEKKVAEKSFGKKEKESIILLPGVISRKKQIIPKLAKILGK